MLSRIVLFSASSVAATALLVAGCGGRRGRRDGRPVVAAFYPLAFAAEQIAGAGADVKNLTPAGAEPHDLELTPGDVRAVDGAALVLYLGDGFMPGLETAVEQRERPLARPARRRGAAAGAGRTARSCRDPHVWLDPVRYAAMVRAIGAALGRRRRGRAPRAAGSSGSTPSTAAASRAASAGRSSRATPRSATSRPATASSRSRSRGSRPRRSRRRRDIASLVDLVQVVGRDDGVLRDARLAEAGADGRARGGRRDGGARPARGADGRRDRGRGRLLHRHAGEPRRARRRRSDAESAEPPVVELDGVSFGYRAGVRVLEDVSLAVGAGEFVAIAGPNGGGKTTLLRLVLGLERPAAGTVRVFGRPATAPASATSRSGPASSARRR